MKILNKLIAPVLALMVSVLGVTACQDAQQDFQHDNNLLSDVRIKLTPGAEGMPGQIFEYDANGNLVPADQVTVKAVEGGYGRVVFELDPSYRGTYNPEACYLGASLTFDEVVSPGLGGIKNICNRDADGVAQGMDVIVTSGIGTQRRYNIVGYFKGEYILKDSQQ